MLTWLQKELEEADAFNVTVEIQTSSHSWDTIKGSLLAADETGLVVSSEDKTPVCLRWDRITKVEVEYL